MKPGRLIYIRGKPVKFARFGGLSPVPQKGYKPNSDTFHSPPTRRGIYAFIWPYIDLFLIGAQDYSGMLSKYSKFEYVKDKDGNRITESHPDFKKYSECKKYWSAFTTDQDANGVSHKTFLIKKKHIKIFTYFGELWHHLGSELSPDLIIEVKGDWAKSSYINFCKALKKTLHKNARDPFDSTNPSTQRWRYSNNPNKNWSTDDLEVFIERV